MNNNNEVSRTRVLLFEIETKNDKRQDGFRCFLIRHSMLLPKFQYRNFFFSKFIRTVFFFYLESKFKPDCQKLVDFTPWRYTCLYSIVFTTLFRLYCKFKLRTEKKMRKTKTNTKCERERQDLNTKNIWRCVHFG